MVEDVRSEARVWQMPGLLTSSSPLHPDWWNSVPSPFLCYRQRSVTQDSWDGSHPIQAR